MFKARMKFAKEGRAKYISHLDLMHTMQRAMARCQMPLWFTEGFNQHAYVSVALPLSTGYSGECEFLDFHIPSDPCHDRTDHQRQKHKSRHKGDIRFIFGSIHQLPGDGCQNQKENNGSYHFHDQTSPRRVVDIG